MSPIIDEAIGLGSRLVRAAQTRFELLSVEIQREKTALVQQLTLAVATGVSASLAAFAAILWVALAFPPDTRFVVLGALVGLFLGVAIVCGVLLMRAARRRDLLFSRIADVLKRDADALERVHESRQDPGPPRDTA